MDIEVAGKILNINPDSLNEFEVEDSFNDNNILKGYICRAPSRYGQMVIYQVNEWKCQQLIYTTPKIDYPFDLNGKYHWPDCKQIKMYEKLDGTNILCYNYVYGYIDKAFKVFRSFKTRLTPTLKDQKFGMFKSMWTEYMKENDWVNKVIESNPQFNLSFELFGSRNPITINYEKPLEVNLLFGIDIFFGLIVPPSSLLLDGTNVKIPKFFDFGQYDDLTKRYNDFRETMSKSNKDSLITEGLVMYADIGDPSWKMFKCKPEEIEKIHWTAGGKIPKLSLINTALNVFESNDSPEISDFMTLLQEEYSEDLLTKNTLKIQSIWNDVIKRIEFTNKVNEVFILAKQNGLDVTKDKNETMRFMSKYFDKSVMGKVGGAVLKIAGLL